jgi:hypothetical protein
MVCVIFYKDAKERQWRQQSDLPLYLVITLDSINVLLLFLFTLDKWSGARDHEAAHLQDSSVRWPVHILSDSACK